MRPKHYPWVAIAGVFFIFILWSAYRWGDSQRFPDGNMFDHMEHERKRKLAESIKPEPVPTTTAESRLSVGGPVFVASLYDATHVVFMAGADTESRFGRATRTAVRIASSRKPAAQLAGLQELWDADSLSPAGLPEIVKHTAAGEQWLLQVSADHTIPVVIERAVVAPSGSIFGAGFLAAVPPDQQAALATSSREYFVVRHSPAQSCEHPQSLPQPIELAAWKPTPDFEARMKQLLEDRMKQELSRIDAEVRANPDNPGQDEDPWFAAQARLDLWKRTDASLVRGEGKLDYDARAFRITPDGLPRVFVRARWQIAEERVFFMTAWFRAEAKPVLLMADSSWSSALREGKADDTAWDGLNFQTILNEFDADHDGWAELLVYTNDGTAAHITMDLYTDLGLVATKTSLRRELK